MNMRTKIDTRKTAELKRGVGRKRRVNLSIDADVLKDAKALGLNLSIEAEKAIRAALSLRWNDENMAAIEAFNRDVEKNGVWSDGLRTW